MYQVIFASFVVVVVVVFLSIKLVSTVKMLFLNLQLSYIVRK